MGLTPNQQLFEYRVQHLLDRGVFGTVYLAYDTVLKPIALSQTALYHEQALLSRGCLLARVLVVGRGGADD